MNVQGFLGSLRAFLVAGLCVGLTHCDRAGGSGDSGPADGDDGSAEDARDGADGGDDGTDAPLNPWPEGRFISPEEVHERLVAEEFYNLGHIEGSLVIPWDELEGRLDEVDRSRSIVVYCRLGVRSESAYGTLVDHDYERVWIMEGGLTAWTELGYPTIPD
jgi:rhodanese-related sulfurtransferase